MKIETLFRHMREAYRGVKRNTWMSFAAISAVAVTLFIFGIFLIFAFNVRYMVTELNKQLVVRASLEESITNQGQEELLKQVQGISGVKTAKLVPKEEGLRRFKADWGDDDAEKLFEGFDKDNPLPDVIEIEPQNPDNIKQIEEKVKGLRGVAETTSGDQVTDKLVSLSSFTRNIVLVFGLGLAVLAAFLISNTIKLTIIARKREIEIQRLVGASNWFIRWPFFIEGAFIGIVGAIVPTVIVLTLYQVAYTTLGAGEASSVLKMMPLLSLGTYVALSIFALGAAIGTTGSLISVRRFLRV
ncbi:permease-like cell division protein FtsX [Laceyella tengchongensis]|jgi:cell division transport system permease protein|uniref:Cell division protein FtsX n=1 Tax=Laceyella tengchongensis TaxID=574699 RepID=A0AA45WRJ9_9BACL|nr:permease-like cell division protein FtsX [Laceyella tengchongensis]SMP31488.1 cell division transport system permease protein [Laceyella tengchongensis]